MADTHNIGKTILHTGIAVCTALPQLAIHTANFNQNRNPNPLQVP